MPDLADFLAARLDEDDAVARSAADLPCCEPLGWDAADRWSHRPRGLLTRNDGGRAITLLTPGMATSIDSGVDLIRAEDGGIPENVADHIVTWDPARALAEVKAKRRHLAMWQEANDTGRAALERLHAAKDDGEIKRASHDYSEFLGAQGVMQDIIALDAEVYADHPDYEQAVSRGLSTLPPEQRYDA